jgi:tetrapyrrole methylase family protein/MazG family protein
MTSPAEGDRTCAEFRRLLDIVAELRGDGGCPWDREQTPESLKRFVLEEAYEVCEAIDSGDPRLVAEELGDLLLQIVLQAQIAQESNRFSAEDVAAGVADKLVRRHPWVFGDVEAASAAEVLDNWERLKREEKSGEAAAESLLASVPGYLPALMKAHRVQSKASHVGFDWERPEQALAKVDEEVAEVREALAGDGTALFEELGDLLFAVVNVARLAKVDAEQSLLAATRKFSNRFARIERAAGERGSSLDELSLAEMDALWDAHKESGEADDAA